MASFTGRSGRGRGDSGGGRDFGNGDIPIIIINNTTTIIY